MMKFPEKLRCKNVIEWVKIYVWVVIVSEAWLPIEYVGEFILCSEHGL